MEIAIVGATGAVGRQMLRDLEESAVQDIKLRPFASERSAGEVLTFRGQPVEVAPFRVEALRGIRFVLMSAGGKLSKEVAKSLVAQGSTVIDNSSAWRQDRDIPLIVPEVNGELLQDACKPTVIANPNCSTIQLVVALKPLQKAFGLNMVQVATYQAVSGTGQKGIKELSDQIEAHSKFQEAEPQVYAQPIAFNVLPAIDILDDAGHCYEEIKVVRETRRILGQEDLDVLAATVRVPVFNCHSEAVAVCLGKSVTREQVIEALADAPGLVVERADDHHQFPTPRRVSGQKSVHVARLRLPWGFSSSKWVQFWVVADNLKKGAATNAVQILEKLI